MNLMRRFHLLLGCFFAPALLFFTVSGIFQTLRLHKDVKNGYQAPEILKVMAKIHKDQKLPDAPDAPPQPPSWLLQGFVLLMSAGFLLSTGVGLAIAFKYFRPRWVLWALLAAGGILPVALLMVG
jgi:hypothetical protein